MVNDRQRTALLRMEGWAAAQRHGCCSLVADKPLAAVEIDSIARRLEPRARRSLGFVAPDDYREFLLTYGPARLRFSEDLLTYGDEVRDDIGPSDFRTLKQQFWIYDPHEVAERTHAIHFPADLEVDGRTVSNDHLIAFAEHLRSPDVVWCFASGADRSSEILAFDVDSPLVGARDVDSGACIRAPRRVFADFTSWFEAYVESCTGSDLAAMFRIP